MRSKTWIKILVGLLALVLMACSLLTKPIPTTFPLTKEPISSPALNITETIQVNTGVGNLHVVGSSYFTDEWGGFHVVGLVQNNSQSALTSIELTIEIKDAAGNSLIKDDQGETVANITFAPLLYTLASGESSPFRYDYDAANGVPDTFSVNVASYQETEVKRPKLVVENVHMIGDGASSIYISGEIVNQSAQWAHINGLSGAALNENQQILSADWSGTYSTELAPSGDPDGNGRTPFIVTIPDPGNPYSTWGIYMDADVIDKPQTYSVKIDLSNNYLDTYGSFHIVGTITNLSNEKLSILLVAGVYDDNSTVLDAYYSFVPITAETGDEVPFDISGFSNINYNSDQAGKIDSFTVQVDPYSTYPALGESVKLESSDANCIQDSGIWNCKGTVVNSSGKELSGETIVAGIYDVSGKIVASDYTYVFPQGDTIASGDVNSYDFSIDVDPLVDMSDYTFRVYIQGDVK
jgi:hypothetical protein